MIDALKKGREGDIGAGGVPPHWEGVRSNVEAGAVGGGHGGGGGRGGEHSVKRFMNVKVKSSKEEVKVHAKNELVSETMYICLTKTFLANSCGLV